MGKLISLMRRAPKRTSAVLAIVAAVLIIPATLLAWGPGRATFTTAVPASYVTFNSITDNPTQGDERNFVQVRDAAASNTTYADSIALTAGKEYVVFVYFHNNAASNLNASGVGIAHGAYVKAQIPALVANNGSAQAVGYVGATNANPNQVWDDVTFTNATGGDIALDYVPDSATIHSFGAVDGQTMSNSIVTTGAPIGYDALNGDLPGCNQYAGYVTFRVKANQPNFTVQKQVRLAGTTTWSKTVAAKAGDTVEYMVQYQNTGTMEQDNVVMKDALPAGISYVNGSTQVKNTTNPNGKTINDDLTTGTGVNIGNYTAASNAYVKFSAKVNSDSTLPCGNSTLVNTATVETANGSKQDTANVTVSKTCQPNLINVCELSSNTIVSIKDTDFDSTKYTKDLTKCAATSISVCELSSKTIVSIKDTDFDSSKYTKDLTKCAPTTTPPELPHTGIGTDVSAFLGLGSLIASIGYYVNSRRAILNR